MICKIWDVDSANSVEYEIENINVPTMFIHGRLDPFRPATILEEKIEEN